VVTISAFDEKAFLEIVLGGDGLRTPSASQSSRGQTAAGLPENSFEVNASI
jgi:hypothetical protein